MTKNETDFFVAVAAAIPVLLVAYTFQFTQFATHKLGPSYDRSMRTYLLSLTNFATRRAARIGRTGGGALVALLLGVFLVILLLSVVLPVVGEYESVNALATDSASTTTKLLAWIGLWVALIAVTVPLVLVVLRAFSFFPFFAYWKTVRANAEGMEDIYANWSACETWFDANITFKLVRENESTEWIGAANFDHFKTAAWGSEYPKHRGTVIIDDKRVIVLDRVGSQKGATLFEAQDQKLKRLVAYDSRDQAIAANDPPRPIQTLLALVSYR